MSIQFSNYGQDRTVNATDKEIEIFELIKETAGLEGILLVRRSDSYVTATYKEWDLARFKFTERAKWIAFPAVETGPTKHRINSPEDVTGFGDLLAASIETINKF